MLTIVLFSQVLPVNKASVSSKDQHLADKQPTQALRCLQNQPVLVKGVKEHISSTV